MVQRVLPTGLALCCLVWISSLTCAQTQDSPEDAIRRVLEQQANAWNEGKIPEYMEHYWKSDDLSFLSGGERRFGWKTVLERYQRRYATREQMGKLTFSDLKIRLLGEELALVLGDWKLRRVEDEPQGNFSLVLQRFNGKWVIVHDHTSLREAADSGADE